MIAGCSSSSPTQPPPTPPVPDASPPPPEIRPLFLEGEAIGADAVPAPLTFGTLLTAKKGPLAFAAIADRGRIDVIDVDRQQKIASIETGLDSEPGRMVEDDDGKIHVVLRRAGMVATVDPATMTMTTRSVCPAPRGIAATSTSVWVACATGELVELLPNGDKHVDVLARDLRDVVVRNGDLYVSRFRSAEVFKPASAEYAFGSSGTSVLPPDRRKSALVPFVARVAWRMFSASDGIYELHQYEAERVIILGAIGNASTNLPTYGSTHTGNTLSPLLPNNESLVSTALTKIDTGELAAPEVMSGVDAAISPVTHAIAFATLALSDGRPGVVVFNGPSTTPKQIIPTTGFPVGVAYTHDGRLLVQTRDPSEIDIEVNNKRIALTASVHDTGASIFHTPGRSGLACMSCHPEGGDDGHTWTFATATGAPLFLRRTQALRGGLLATAPFHWSGDMASLSELAHDVFTKRMGGDVLTEPQVSLLGRFLDWIPTLPAPSTLDPSAALRGKSAFAKAGCDGCHRGIHFTDNASHAVGTYGEYQTPSLVNVAARGPWMHNGCAATLMDRLVRPECGGSAHGNPKALTNEERSDLVAYLESL